MDILHYCFLVVAGLLSGFINVLAGAGSLIVLPVLIGMGLPPVVANGTNRVSIVAQDLAGIYQFFKSKKLPWKTGLILGIPTVLGALAGSLLGVRVTGEFFNITILIVLVLMLAYVIFNREGKTAEGKVRIPVKKMDSVTFVLLLLIGAYAGFIQGGATLIWYVLLTWRLKYDMITADAIKIFLNLIMTPVALIIFIMHGQVSYLDGLILGAGSFLGAWIGAKTAMKINKSTVRIMMIVILLMASLYMLFFKIM